MIRPATPPAFSPRVRPRGFYAVLDRGDEDLARALVGAGGARVLQVRLKPAPVDERSESAGSGSPAGSAGRAGGGAPRGIDEVVAVARMARRVCDEAGAALVINDRVDVALAVGADGVHLGQTDLPLAEARRLAGGRLSIGVSTHDLDQVMRACAGGADYIGFGPVFATQTKDNPDPVQGIAGLRAAVRAAGRTPVVAIGGIAPAEARALYGAGAAALCAIRAVNGAPDARAVATAARALGRPSPWLRGAYTVLRRTYGPLHDARARFAP